MKPDAFERRRGVRFDDIAKQTIEQITEHLAKGEYRYLASLSQSDPNVVPKVLQHFRQLGWGLPPEEKGDLEGDETYVKYWENLNDAGGFYIFMTPQIRADKKYEMESNNKQRLWLNRKAKAEQEDAERVRLAEQHDG